MDPVTISALILAVASGAASEAGSKLWDALTALVHRPILSRHDAGQQAIPESGGLAELAAVERAPADQDGALNLAKVLADRAEADVSFGAELRSWLAQASRVNAGAGSVSNTISGGIQHGPVLQGRDFTGLTFNAGPPSQPHD